MIPKGIRTRPTPDWFVYYLSQMGFGNPPGGHSTTEFQLVAIYNDSTRGAFLYMWGISLIMSDADFGQVAIVKGPFGTPQVNGARVNPTVGAPPGQLLYDHNGPTPYGFTPQTTLPSFVAGPGAYNYPVMVIPAGYSMLIWSPVLCDEFQVSCWYIPMLDPFGRTPI